MAYRSKEGIEFTQGRNEQTVTREIVEGIIKEQELGLAEVKILYQFMVRYAESRSIYVGGRSRMLDGMLSEIELKMFSLDEKERRKV